MKKSADVPLDIVVDELVVPKGKRHGKSTHKRSPSTAFGSASNIIVDSTADLIDPNDGVTTLREAIALASRGGTKTITFNLATDSQIKLMETLTIRSDAVLKGNGVTISGDGTFANFFFANDVLLDASAKNNLVGITDSSFSGNGGAIADGGRKNVIVPRSASVSIPIENAGFEDPALEDFTFTTAPPSGWEVYNPDGLIPEVTTDESSSSGVFNPSTGNYPDGVPEGENVGCLFLIDEVGSGRAGISQTLDALLAPNTRYTLSVAVGNPAGEDPVPGITFGGFPGYQVELLAGGEVIAVDNNSLKIKEGTFKTSTLKYTASARDPLLGKPLEIRLINLLQEPGIEVDFDDVQLTAQPLSGKGGSRRIGSGVKKLDESPHPVLFPEPIFGVQPSSFE